MIKDDDAGLTYPWRPRGDYQFNNSDGTLRQVKGKTLILGQGSLNLSSTDCNGTPHTFDFTFFGDAPFNSGVAVVGVSIVLFFVDPITLEQANASGSAGVKEIRLKN